MESKVTLYSNLLSQAVPSELGNLVNLASNLGVLAAACMSLIFECASTHLPTPRLSHLLFLPPLDVNANSLSLTLPTQLGRLVEMVSDWRFDTNDLTGAYPQPLNPNDIP